MATDLEELDALLQRVVSSAQRARAWYWTAAVMSAAAILLSVISDTRGATEAADAGPGLGVAAWLLIAFALGANGIIVIQQRRFRAALYAYTTARAVVAPHR